MIAAIARVDAGGARLSRDDSSTREAEEVATTEAGSGSPVDEAAFDMDQLDFDFYLFRDRVSGHDALLERRSDGSYRLTRLRSTAITHTPTTLTLEHAEHGAPTLVLDEAIERIGADGERFVFFANSATGRGNVLYRRYDGHYGLIAPD